MGRGLRIVAWSSLPLAGLAVALVFATSGAAAPARTPRVNALIVGKVLVCGGGFPSPHGGCSLDDDALVSAFNSGHQLAAREEITDGHFSFLVPPGSFTVALEQCRVFRRRPLEFKDCHAYRQRAVTAKAGQTVHANVSFQAH